MHYNITYRQKDKGWQYIISYKTGGVWKQKSKQGFATKKAAQLSALERTKELEKQISLENTLNPELKGILFIDFANKLIEHEKLYKEPNTIILYKKALASFEDIHNMPIENIKPINIQDIVDKLIKKELNISTIKLYTSKISYMFNQAITHYAIILQNPIKNIQYPTQNLKEQNKKIKALTKDEVSTLLAQIQQNYPKYHLLCLTAVTTGLRIGELLGLTYSDINFDTATLNIDKQWKLLKSGKQGLGILKSKNSIRQIPIPNRTLEALKLELKLPNQTHTTRIFPFPTNCQATLHAIFKKLNFNISIHDLRHTYATFLISSGLDIKTTAHLLGHDTSMTLKTYTHTTTDMLQSAKQKINLL